MTKYVIITPARDEAAHIDNTIDAVSRQTVRPERWIIVDDGSTDSTGTIIDQAANRFHWITSLHRSNRGFRQAGGGVIDAFNYGLESLAESDWEFLVKLDADLSFDADYFERCFEQFRTDPKLGIGGGGIYHSEDGVLKLEAGPAFHVRGATKIYKRDCWNELGGLVAAPGWDTIDEVKANMLGWKTQSFPHLKISHYRVTGAADGVWKDSVKNGLANYVTGYHPLFMLMKCVKRLFARPYLIGSVGLGWGFIKGHFSGARKVEDQELVQYTRDQQMRRLLGQESVWK